MSYIIEISGLEKTFGGLTAISELDFSVTEGSITAIIGPNGAGKTTLFNLISGLLKPDKGEIIFKDKRIDVLKPFEIPPLGISRTFQNLSVFSNMNVLENVMSGRYVLSKSGFFFNSLKIKTASKEEQEIREKALFWLKFMNLDELKEMPVGIIPFEKQRLVEITRAVAGEPELILLDEPAAGLNITETKNLTDVIYKVRELGVTILLVEHDIDLVMEVSDRVIVLNFGKKIAEGLPEEIRKNKRVIEVYLGG